MGFVLKKYLPKAKSELLYVPSHAGTFTRDALHARVTVNGKQKEVFLYGKKGKPALPGMLCLKVLLFPFPMDRWSIPFLLP